MTMRTWIRNLFASRRARTIRRAMPRSRPALEALEDRTVPTVFTPDLFTDGVSSAGIHTLRDAVIATNASATSDTINLNAGTYALTITNTNSKQENAARTGDLDVTKQSSFPLIIQGQGTTGANATIIDASALLDRVFQIVNPGTVVYFKDLVIKGGLAQDDGTAGAQSGTTNSLGGGILNFNGYINAQDVVFDSNTAGGSSHDARGGALYSIGGSLLVAGSTFSNNQALGGAGASGIEGNHDTDAGDGSAGGTGSGGALYVIGSVTIDSTSVIGNVARGGGGGAGGFIDNPSEPSDRLPGDGGVGGAGQGGGIFVGGGTVSFGALTTLSNNVAAGGQGGSFGYKSAPLVFANGGAGGSGQGGGLYASGTSVVTFAGSSVFQVSSNRVQGGLGFASNTQSDLGESGGDAQGGGIFAAGASMDVSGAVFSLNVVQGGRGGEEGKRYNAGNGGHGQGAGLYAAAGSVNVTNTTFASNQAIGGPAGMGVFERVDSTAPWGGGANGNGQGGGIFAGGAALTLNNSTLTANGTQGGSNYLELAERTFRESDPAGKSEGGGLFTADGLSTVTNTTFSMNTAAAGISIVAGAENVVAGGGIFNGAALSLVNSIVAGNSLLLDFGGSRRVDDDVANFGTLSGDHNLIQDGSGGLADTLVANPLLSPLGDHGGPTPTLALLPGSPAIGAGVAVSGLPTDQRGVARTGPIDVGAFQSRGFTITIAGGDGQSAYLRTAFVSPPTVTVTSDFGEPVAGGQVIFANVPSDQEASATFGGSGAVPIAADGSATLPFIPIANAVVGTYSTITATTSRSNIAHFTLTNLAVPDLIAPTSFNDGLAPGSLRSLVIATNADPTTATKTINLNSGTYTLTITNPRLNPTTAINFQTLQENAARTGDLDVTNTAHTLIIQGQGATGANATIIDASALLDRVFQIVNPGTVVQFKDLVIRGGLAQDDGTAGVKSGTTVAPDGSAAAGFGVPAAAAILSGTTAALGGGILDNGGNLTFDHVVFDSNTALGGETQEAAGGAVYAGDGSVLSIADTTFSSNRAVGGAGSQGYWLADVPQNPGPGLAGRGGAVYAIGSSVMLSNSTFSSNAARGGDGGYAVVPSFLGNSIALEVLQHGVMNGTEGGIGEGGAVSTSNGVITITDSTFFANTAQGGNGSDGKSGFLVTAAGGAGGNGQGGAVSTSNGVITIDNSTFSANAATGGSGGTAISRGPRVGVDGAAGIGEVGALLIGGTATLNNSIVAGSSGGDVAIRGGTLAGSHNLIQDGSGGLADTMVADPLLGPLENNGGPTQTLALLPGSPAIDAGSDALIPIGLTIDQRGAGFPRLLGKHVDVGAYEISTRASIAKFEQALYQNELGRTAGATDVANWTEVLGVAGLAAVVDGIANSVEARSRLVAGWFQTYLGRTADATSIDDFATALGSQTEEQVLSAIVGSTEFYNRAQTLGFGGTADENFVLALYQSLLGRTASTAEVADQVTALQQVGPQALALGFLQSQEYRTIVVTGYYTGLLGRAGSPEDVANFVTSSLDVRTIRLAFESSQEFFNTAASRVPTITSITVPATANEAAPVGLSATATNPAGDSFPLSYTWTVTRPDATTFTLTGASPSFTPPDDGSYGVNLTVADEDGFSTTTSRTVAVAPTPTLTAVTTSAASSTYGDSVTFTATVTGDSTPTGSVNFVIDSGAPVAGIAGTTTGITTTWTYVTSSLPAGAHTVEAFYVGSGGFADSSGTLSGGQMVNKANATVVVTPYTVTYDGSPHVATVTSITGVNGETGVAVGSVDVSNTAHTDAGTYSDTWTFTGANYNDASATITDVLDKAASAVVVTINGGPFTYTRLAQTPATALVTGTGLNLTPTANYANNVDAGTATASYTYAGDANHTGSSDSKNFAIARADAMVTVTGYSGTADGTSHGATGSVVGVAGDLLVAGSSLNLGTRFTDAPGGTAFWNFDGGTNYNDQSGSVAITLAAVLTPAPGGTGTSGHSVASGNYLNPATGDRSAALAGLSAQQRFIQALYLAVLGRAGSVAELNGWLATLNGPNGQSMVAQGIESSQEGRDNLVKGWYQTYLGRAAQGGEERGHVNALLAGMTEEAVLSGILGSDEFFAHAQTIVSSGTPQERFVQALYVFLLGRTPDAGEIAGHVAELSGGKSQAQVALGFLRGPEFRTNLVALYYSALLHRNASAAEINGHAASGLGADLIQLSFESSPEFFVNG